MEERVYYYRGQVERWVPSRRTYEWRDGYSQNSLNGFAQYPWRTMKECRDEAHNDGVQAVFKKSE